MKRTAKILSVFMAVVLLLQSTLIVYGATTKSGFTGNSYTHNSQFDNCEILDGIDVSEWQKNINWSKVKADGVDFAIIRAGYGKNASQVDDYFEQNYKNAKAVGMPIGTYWYSYADSIENVKKEAALCIQTLKGKSFELPVYFDLEESTQFKKGEDFCTQAVQTFCDAIAAAGYTPGLYMSRSPMMTYISPEVRNKYEMWVAEYGSSTCKYVGDYGMWQYASNGKVNGISGSVDVNFRYVSPYTTLPDQTYTGKEITPMPEIKNSNNEILQPDVDYTLTYKNNKNIGSATVTAIGINAYEGTNWHFKFKIVPAKVTGLTLESRTKTSLTYTWKKVAGASAYRVSLYDSTSNKQITKTTSGTKITISNLTDTHNYRAKVAAYKNTVDNMGPYSNENTKHTLPGQVTGLAVKSSTTNAITLQWKKKAGASGYYIYQYNPSKKKTTKIATVKGSGTTTYKVTKKAAGTYYYYYVAAYTVDSKTKIGAKSKKLTASTKPKTTSLSSVKSTSSKKMTVKWKKVSCTGYAIQYSTKKNFSSDVKTVYVGGSKTSVTIKTSKSKKTYYVRVRPYKLPNNKRLYGSFSKVKSVKVK